MFTATSFIFIVEVLFLLEPFLILTDFSLKKKTLLLLTRTKELCRC